MQHVAQVYRLVCRTARGSEFSWEEAGVILFFDVDSRLLFLVLENRKPVCVPNHHARRLVPSVQLARV